MSFQNYSLKKHGKLYFHKNQIICKGEKIQDIISLNTFMIFNDPKNKLEVSVTTRGELVKCDTGYTT